MGTSRSGPEDCIQLLNFCSNTCIAFVHYWEYYLLLMGTNVYFSLSGVYIRVWAPLYRSGPEDCIKLLNFCSNTCIAFVHYWEYYLLLMGTNVYFSLSGVYIRGISNIITYGHL